MQHSILEEKNILTSRLQTAVVLFIVIPATVSVQAGIKVKEAHFWKMQQHFLVKIFTPLSKTKKRIWVVCFYK